MQDNLADVVTVACCIRALYCADYTPSEALMSRITPMQRQLLTECPNSVGDTWGVGKLSGAKVRNHFSRL